MDDRPPITARELPDEVMQQIVRLANNADPSVLVVSVIAGGPDMGLAHSLWFAGGPDAIDEALGLMRHVAGSDPVEHQVMHDGFDPT